MFIKNDFSCEELLEDDKITEENDILFVNQLVDCYKQNEQDINNIINKYLTGYTPDRVYRIDRAILSVAISEILYYKQTPFKIVVNEAIEMAKKYSTEKSYSFVNGILKKVLEGENVI